MNKTRQSIITMIQSIKLIQDKCIALKDELIYLEGLESYQQNQKYYTNIIASLNKELNTKPIGYKYTGTFYIRKPYTIPVEYEKIVGSAFMREDLVSWAILQEERFNGIYYRAIFKEPNDKFIITREDAKPVFSKLEA